MPEPKRDYPALSIEKKTTKKGKEIYVLHAENYDTGEGDGVLISEYAAELLRDAGVPLKNARPRQQDRIVVVFTVDYEPSTFQFDEPVHYDGSQAIADFLNEAVKQYAVSQKINHYRLSEPVVFHANRGVTSQISGMLERVQAELSFD